MAKKKGLYYYAVQPEVIHYICETYLNGFYVYVAEVFSPRNPHSSDPQKLHCDLRDAAETNDAGNSKIETLKDRFLKIMLEKHRTGEISDATLQDINWILERASPFDYRPLIYVIRRDVIDRKNRAKPVPIPKLPHFKSKEYTIGDLTEKEFEIIETTLSLKLP